MWYRQYGKRDYKFDCLQRIVVRALYRPQHGERAKKDRIVFKVNISNIESRFPMHASEADVGRRRASHHDRLRRRGLGRNWLAYQRRLGWFKVKSVKNPRYDLLTRILVRVNV